MHLTKLTLLIASAAVFSYMAFVWYDCTHDADCHVVYCGASHKPCGFARKHAERP